LWQTGAKRAPTAVPVRFDDDCASSVLENGAAVSVMWLVPVGGAEPARRPLTHASVDPPRQKVGVAVVPGVLLAHVHQDLAGRDRLLAVGTGAIEIGRGPPQVFRRFGQPGQHLIGKRQAHNRPCIKGR
jgi:hypothetical protein